ncbi:hypothetical protein AO703_08995 [[Enterobacter] lignolyticus]|uniref:Uncharacterized protein n=1 Tax=[Enterobacter] lignolyticus TaxID=1334193 RepID=A0A806X427_9ENTR|nr:hypothetical protein AO703_08995 [[Enterobacter] lignolyticus]
MSSGYSQCSWKDNGNGTTTFGVTISFNDTAGRTGTARFISRGILVYTYDKSGNLNSSSLVADAVFINGVKHDRGGQPGNYAIYMNLAGGWYYTSAFTAKVEVTVQNKKIADWPAIAIRAGNYTSGDDVAEKTGGAYVGMGNVSNSDCVNLTDPSVSPPPPPPPLQTLVLTMTAPDWDLGELPRGDSKKTFNGLNELLCFETAGVIGDIKTGRFVIDASNANGRDKNSRYLLRNLADASQTVPYSILLFHAGNGAPTMLPNDSNISVPFDENPRNCFIPTFSTSVGDGVKGGTYSDVLTFTVVTKP